MARLCSPADSPSVRTPPDTVKVTTSGATTQRRRLSVKAHRWNRFGSSPEARVPQNRTVSSSPELSRHLWPVQADTDRTCGGRANHFTPTGLQLSVWPSSVRRRRTAGLSRGGGESAPGNAYSKCKRFHRSPVSIGCTRRPHNSSTHRSRLPNHVERMLGPVLAYETRHKADLLSVVDALVR